MRLAARLSGIFAVLITETPDRASYAAQSNAKIGLAQIVFVPAELQQAMFAALAQLTSFQKAHGIQKDSAHFLAAAGQRV